MILKKKYEKRRKKKNTYNINMYAKILVIFFAVIVISCSIYFFLNFIHKKTKYDILFELCSDRLGGRPSGKNKKTSEYLVSLLQNYKQEKWAPNFIHKFKQNGKIYRNVIFSIYPDKFDEIRSQTVVIMAHYDHLGKKGKKIYRGANDNASGVYVLLKIAEYLQKHTDKLNYHVLFLLTDGEEESCVGSKKIADQKHLQKYSIRFMINFDMLGGCTKNTINTVLIDHNNKQLMHDANKGVGLQINFTPRNERTDYRSFFKFKYPGFDFGHCLVDTYHSESDTINKIQFKTLDKCIQLISNVIMILRKN